MDQEDVEEEFLDDRPPYHLLGSSFSYHESIHEFNQVQYGGASYSMYQLGKHLLNLIFRWPVFRRQHDIESRNREREEALQAMHTL
jgi:hypothetical protein